MIPRSQTFGKPEINKDLFSSLSKAEQEKLVKENPSMAKTLGFKTDEEQKISKVKHDEEVAELKDKIKVLNTKIDDLRKQNTDVRKERDDYEDRFNKKRGEISDLQQENDSLRKQIHAANEELAELRKKPKAVPVKEDAETIQLKKQLRASERDISTLNARLQESEVAREESEERIQDLEGEKKGLEAELLSLKNSQLESEGPVMPDLEPVGSVRLDSLSSLSSDLFTSRRYSVRVAKDLSYIKIRPDAEGLVFCEGGKLDIPALSEYIQFEPGTEFKVSSFEGTMMIRL